MSKDVPVETVSELLVELRLGSKKIYIASNLYMKKFEPNKECNTMLGEIIQIAYAYGCEFIEVDI